MSHRNDNAPKPELNLNLASARVVNPRPEPPAQSIVLSPPSPASSCVSSEVNQDDHNNNFPAFSTNPEADSLVVVGCYNCFMYVMISENNLRCPQCKKTALVHFLKEDDNNGIKRE
ncbi:hypothetical protein VNO78_21095 [Psophocarpus tetragonolobus]|uniref:GIR1-like zinc ribbon domain-containing protein n=1 Tax=Psophocarpus tetragonolobus TaxID=3891 RepID=A0AAN9SB48_PSOTE